MNNNNPNYLLINSKYRNDYYNTNSSNFRIYFNKNINIEKYIKLQYFSISRTNYLMTEINNKFKINFSNNQSINILISIGNYSPLQLCEVINLQINNLNGFNLTYNSQIFKLSFNCDIEFNIDFTQSDFYKLLNFEKRIYNSVNNKIVSNIIFFNYPLYLNLVIKNISSSTFLNSDNSRESHFIINCGSTYNFGDNIQYKSNENDIKILVDNINITYLDFVLMDDENRIYDSNNIDYYFIIQYQ